MDCSSIGHGLKNVHDFRSKEAGENYRNPNQNNVDNLKYIKRM
jgi:hypothetical protein